MSFAFIQGIGPTELIIVLVIVLVIFGPKRLPGVARSVGAGMRELKDSFASKSDDDEDDAPRPGPRAEVHAALGRPEQAEAEERDEAEERVEGEVVPERR